VLGERGEAADCRPMIITSLWRHPGLFMATEELADERFFEDNEEVKSLHFFGAGACADASDESVDDDQRLRSCGSGFDGGGGGGEGRVFEEETELGKEGDACE